MQRRSPECFTPCGVRIVHLPSIVTYCVLSTKNKGEGIHRGSWANLAAGA